MPLASWCGTPTISVRRDLVETFGHMRMTTPGGGAMNPILGVAHIFSNLSVGCNVRTKPLIKQRRPEHDEETAKGRGHSYRCDCRRPSGSSPPVATFH